MVSIYFPFVDTSPDRASFLYFFEYLSLILKEMVLLYEPLALLHFL